MDKNIGDFTVTRPDVPEGKIPSNVYVSVMMHVDRYGGPLKCPKIELRSISDVLDLEYAIKVIKRDHFIK